MNPLITKIQESENRFDDFGVIFSFPHNAKNAKAEIEHRDGFPMLYNGLYVTHDIQSFHRSSLISLFKAYIERLEGSKRTHHYGVDGSDCDNAYECEKFTAYERAVNYFIDQEIAFMRETIKSLENEN